MVIALSICASAVGSIGLISNLLRKAPEGWEDANGFHHISAPSARRVVHMRKQVVKPSAFAREVRPALLATAALR
ncbi:MAG: hypothetical protein M3032_08065 [Verrucomicrobiota bacterium]|nr:hypothetical protein [Verrucomicrobiota bacterium]